MGHLKYYLVLIIYVSGINAFSQNQTSKWCFGNFGGLDFMTSPPTTLTGVAIATNEGCSSIADAAGNLLFYTDGITVWNSSNAVMLNGTGLLGNSSTTQSGVIVKQPGNNNIFYVFTLGTGSGLNNLNYSIVDMSLAAGSGSVVSKNIFLNGSSTEKLTSVRHCNGTDVWVVTHDLGSNNFRIYLVTSAGVNPVAVVSSVGTVHNGFAGYLKASPQGLKLGVCIYNNVVNDQFELYDFDASSGIVSNPLVLASLSFPIGCEFSPDGSKFYGTRESVNTLYQWDLCAGSNTAIIASQYTTATTQNQGLGALQVALNGKIYVARLQQQSLGVINNPNVYGAGCNYVDLGQSIAPGICKYGLPNFITSLFQNSSTFSSTLTPLIACGLLTCSAPTVASGGLTMCSGPQNTLTSYLWNFGDPLSGAANTSTLANASHTYSTAGTYTVLLTIYGACGTTYVTKEISVYPAVPINIVGSQSICSGISTTLTAVGATTYSWLTGATTASVVVSPTVTSSYSVFAIDASGCSSSRTTTVNVSAFGNNPAFTITGNFSICAGATTTLTGVGASSYTWNTNITSPSLVVTPSVTTSYNVVAKAINTCQDSRTVTVQVFKCTGINQWIDANNKEEANIYPNPNDGKFYLETNLKTSFKVYNQLGILVYTGNVILEKQPIDLSGLAKGIYYVHIGKEKTGKVLKLIKSE